VDDSAAAAAAIVHRVPSIVARKSRSCR